MNENKIFWLSVLSFTILCGFSIYLHLGFVDFVHNVIYSKDKIPYEHKNDVYYFMDDKIRFKNISVLVFFIISVTSFYFLWINSKKIITKFLLLLEIIIVVVSILMYLFRIGIYVT